MDNDVSIQQQQQQNRSLIIYIDVGFDKTEMGHCVFVVVVRVKDVR